MGIEIKADFQGNGYMRPAIKELIKETQRQKVDVLTDTVPNT